MQPNASFRSLNQTRLSAGRSNRARFFDFFPKDYGDSIKNAEEIGTVKRGKSYNYADDVGGGDLDFFEFKLERNGRIAATLKNESDRQPIAVTLLNQQGRPVKKNGQFAFLNVEVGQTQTLSVRGLKKGNYFLRVQSEEGNDEEYELSVSQSGNGSIPGNNQAKNLGDLRPGSNFNESGSVGGNDVDLYQFSLDRTSRILADLDNPSQNGDPIAFSILDSQQRTVQTENGRFLFSNVEAGQKGTLFAPTLASGTYLVRVQSEVGSNESYSLRLSRSDVDVTPL